MGLWQDKREQIQTEVTEVSAGHNFPSEHTLDPPCCLTGPNLEAGKEVPGPHMKGSTHGVASLASKKNSAMSAAALVADL